MDWSKREAYVEPIQSQGRSLWIGDGMPLSFAICQAQKRVLMGEGPDLPFTRRAREQMEELRGFCGVYGGDWAMRKGWQ